MDDEAAELEREYQEEKARERAEAEKLVGAVIGGKYRIDAFVGGGAMGKVYRATQLLLDKTVAVKVLHAGLGQDEKFQARFHREAKAASKMDHPNSVSVIDFGIERDGMMFIVMEFLAGRDLFAALRKEWPFSIERTVEVMSQVLSALAVAHDQGIVHRDLKPENIMLVPKKQDDGTVADVVKVADFGIAKIMDSHRTGANGERLSTAGNIAGTPEYMSPEQAQARSIDGRADLYSCGVILYEMCTGKLPFSAETPIGVVLKHITEQPAPPSTINPAIAPEMEALIMKALAKAPDDRFADARSMRSALRAVVGLRESTNTSLSAAARSAIAAIELSESSESLGQASTMVGVPAPTPVMGTASSVGVAPNPPRTETAKGFAPPTGERIPSGPKGDRTHSTTTSHEVPVAEAVAPPPANPPSPAGVSRGTLISSIVAAVAVGALAVVGVSRRGSVNAEPQSPPQQTPANNRVEANERARGEHDEHAHAANQAPAPSANTAPATQDPPTQPVADPAPANNNAPSANNAAPEPRSARAARSNASNTSAAANTTVANTTVANTTVANTTVANTTVANTTVANTQPAQQPVQQPVQQPIQQTVQQPAHQPVQQPVQQPVAQPTIAPLTGVRGSFAGLSASGGVLVNRLQGRAQTAADSIARCALQQARAQRTADSFTSGIDVTLNIAVAERRLDRLRLLGGPAWLAACGREAEPAFSGDLPEADDPEYTITLRVSLHPQR
jgi:serine/threonine-protein kinase